MKPVIELQPFVSEQVLRGIYQKGLESLVHEHASRGDVAAFVVAAGNAVYSDDIRNRLEPQLRAILDKSTASVRDVLDLVASTHNDDDLVVFLRIAALRLENLETAQFVRRDVWRVQFNRARTFRPRRAAADPFYSLGVPFDRRNFHFNKAYVAKECFWELAGGGAPKISIFFNKFPFARFNLLLVPWKEAEEPQFLTVDAHRLMSAIVRSSQIDGFGAGYNSIGAFPSVNHLHFQVFAEPEGLPVMDKDWTHNGGTRSYPIPCSVFESADEAWSWVAQQHDRNRPYNVIYTRAGVYCFDRKPQLTYDQAEWTTGFAWYELAGCMIVNSPGDLARVTAGDIALELAKLTP